MGGMNKATREARLKEVRKMVRLMNKLDLRQSDISALMGAGSGTVSNWCNEVNVPTGQNWASFPVLISLLKEVSEGKRESLPTKPITPRGLAKAHPSNGLAHRIADVGNKAHSDNKPNVFVSKGWGDSWQITISYRGTRPRIVVQEEL